MSKRKPLPSSKSQSNRKKMAATSRQATKSPKHTPDGLGQNSSALTSLDELKLPIIETEATTSGDYANWSEKENERLDQSQKDNDLASGTEGATASAAPYSGAEQEPSVVDPSELPQHESMLSDLERKRFDALSASATIQACQLKLLEIYSANMQLAFEFAARLVTIASPPELVAVSSEFMSKRAVMFLKHSEQMTELLGRRRPAA